MFKDGIEVKAGNITDVAVAPYESKEFQIALPELTDEKAEYFLNVYTTTKSADALIPEDYLLAYEQFKLTDFTPSVFEMDIKGLSVTNVDGTVTVKGDGFEVGFNSTDGNLTKLDYGQGNLIKTGPSVNFWRAPTDNDYGYNMPKRLNVWKEATETQNLTSFQLNSNDGKKVVDAVKLSKNPFKIKNDLQLTAMYSLPSVQGEASVTYTINNKGDILVSTDLSNIKNSLPIVPRFGNNFIIDSAYDKVSWYGRGPHENYQDRKTSALVGKYDATVKDLYFEYIRPQENGYRTDIRTVSFLNTNGKGIQISSPKLFGFSAHNQYNSDFDEGMEKQQRHTYDIPIRDLININIDYSQMGVGGDDSWGLMPHEEYQIKPDNLSFSFMIKPVK